MNGLAEVRPFLPAMTERAVAAVREMEARQMLCEQVPIRTDHLIHAGIYSRTIRIPAGVALTGTLIKVPTQLVVHGHCAVFTGGEEVLLSGFNVIPCSAGRKSAFIAYTDTWLSMSFPTRATTVEEAEAEFTDETDLLFSRHGENTVTITGE